MRTQQDVEAFLDRASVSFEEVGQDGMWVVSNEPRGEQIVVSLAEPLVLFRVKVLDVDLKQDNSALFKELLHLNATDLVHGAYGLSDSAVVLTCALQLENLDFNEFQATLDDFSLALANHHSALAAHRKAGG